MEKYQNKYFPSGQSYLEHSLNTARFAASWRADEATICYLLLHKLTPEQIRKVLGRNSTFGRMARKIRRMIETHSMITQLPYVDGDYITGIRGNFTLQNYMDMLVLLAGNSQMMLGIFADGLEAVRTVHPQKEKIYRYQFAQHVLLPLARRLEAYEIVDQIANETFKFYNPSEFERVKEETESVLGNSYTETQKELEELRQEIIDILKEAGISNVVVQARVKSVYSIWEKVSSSRRPEYKDIASLNDILGMRLITKNVKEVSEQISLWVENISSGNFAKETDQEKGFTRIKFNFRDKNNRPWELVIISPEDFRRFEFGGIDEENIKIAIPHWIYKIGRTEEIDGVFVVDVPFILPRRRFRQSFITDRSKGAYSFSKNFRRLHRLIKGKLYVLYLYEKGEKRDLSVICLPADSIPADLASHLEIDGLGKDYAGLLRVYLVKHGENPLGEEKERLLLEEEPLRNADVVVLGKRKTEVDWQKIEEKARTLRARLIAKQMNAKIGQEWRESGRDILLRIYRRIDKRLRSKLIVFSRLKGLKNLDELYSAIGIGLVKEEDIFSYFKESRRRKVLIKAKDRVGLLRDITIV
ncbi:MAG: hypothetical protein N2Z79_02915, partial [Candidatus Omnitrophica bacterium]|nr:hypothetical protein [Candidatus Omnitrophota bacterium]